MIFADNIADYNEKKLLNKMAICLGFEAGKTSQVVKTALEMGSKRN